MTCIKHKYTKRLTPKAHYEASVILYRILNGDIPEHINWEIKPEHIEILKMFIIEGMSSHEIERTKKILSKRKRPMSQDMICIWIKKYLPNIEYQEKSAARDRNKDYIEGREFARLKEVLPKTPCAVCGSTEDLELDHIITYIEGGRSTPDNLQWLCHRCHMIKTAKEAKIHGWRYELGHN